MEAYKRYEEFDLTEAVPICYERCVWQRPRQLRNEMFESLHFHKGMEINRCVEGEGLCNLRDTVVYFKPGDILSLPANEIHGIKALSPELTVDIMRYDPILLYGTKYDDWDARFVRRLTSPPQIFLSRRDDNPQLQKIVSVLIHELRRQPDGWLASVRALARFAHIQICRSAPTQSSHAQSLQYQQIIDRLAPALSHIVGNCDKPIRIDDLCSTCGMSVSTLRRAFHSAFGKSPMQYVVDMKIQTAQALLRDPSRPVIDIADAVGYNSLSSFNRHFKMLTGMTPREWRKKVTSDR